LVSHYLNRPATPPHLDALGELTPRELEIFRLVGQGLSNSDIATELVISLATVKTHVRHLLQKLDLRDRIQAVVLAYETRLVEPGDAQPQRHHLARRRLD